MKTLATNENQISSPATRRTGSAVHSPLSAKNRIQRNNIHKILQPKLSIGQPNDKYEREADSVADRIVANQPVAEISSISGSIPSAGIQNVQAETVEEEEQVQPKLIQRRAEEEQEEPVQAKLIQRQAEEEEEPVQAKLVQHQAEEEEEPVQAKLIQHQAEEEEEPVQAKLIQRRAEQEEEEPVQPKLIQHQAEEEEEEPVQAKLIQRQAEEEQEEPVQPKLLQRQADQEEEEPVQPKLIQRLAEKEEDEEVQVQRSIPSTRAVSQAIDNPSTGSLMRPDIRNILESGMGADLSGVRVHEDSAAQAAAASINAKAFTH